MAKVAGVDVLLKVKDSATGTLTVVGGQTGASLSRSASTIDTSDKTTGGWATSMAGLKSWSLDAEGFVSLGDEGQELLELAFENRETVFADIRIGADTNVDGITYTGEAVITKLDNEFGQSDAVTFSLSVEGASPLVRAVGVKAVV
jgi:TP901-1 family phage major tail protein